MKVLKTLEDLNLMGSRKTLGFVATMGALHAGHGALVKRSKSENEQTIVSIFINPTQFNNPEDYKTYPNVLENDLRFCRDLEVDYVFVPSVETIYKDEETIKLNEDSISLNFEGRHRPGHFSGVLTVVLKLLNLISPNNAYFGEKDYQQYLIIKRLVENFFLKTEIVGVETARDTKGLALSSRNLNLSEKGLTKAQIVANAFMSANSKNDFLEKTKDLELNLEYYGEQWDRAFIAHYIEGVRLIDNKPLKEST